MKVSIVVPNWNGEKLIEKNFDSWVSIGADELIFVDDASTDESIAFIRNFVRRGGSNFKLIKNETNLGFARSVNKGVKAAYGDVVILLNTDVKPLPGLLDAVLPHFKDKNVFGVSFSEEQWSWSRGFWKNGFFEHEPGPRTNKTHTTFWVSGGSGAFRKSIWDTLGGFDETYAPFYWEDIDLSYRVAKRGYKLLWEPRAQVEHKHESTIGKYFLKEYVSFIQERNRLIFIWKNITSKKLTVEHWKAVTARIVKSPGYLKTVLSALARWHYISKARSVEKREAKITDEQIFAQF